MLDEAIRALATGKNFGTLSVHLPGGAIGTHLMWVDADRDHLLINTEVHRAKYRAMQADPQVTITVWDAKNPYAYAEVRGHVDGEVRGPQAREHIDALSLRYTGGVYTADVASERVIVRVAPDRQRAVGLD